MKHPYPRYQDSGVEWLGQVPEHWEVAQVRRWFDIVNGGTPASGDDSYWGGETVWLTPDDLGRNSEAWISESRRRITDDGVSNSSARVSPEGSIILSTRAPIGHIAITSVPAATNQGCRTLVPNPKTDSGFAYYSLIASRSLLQALGKGTTFMELTPTELGGFQMIRPGLDEQRSIAAFLDGETAKIDMLVAETRLLLDRLAEYRTALITRTVTKGLPPEAAKQAGLNPNPPCKPSGVEWLGEVPEHWELSQLGRLGSFFKGGGGTKEDEVKGGLPCIRYGDLYTQHDFLIRSSRTGIAEDSTDRYKRLWYGDILFAGSGETIEEIGKSAVNLIQGPAYCGGDVIGFRPSIDTDATFFGYATDCAAASYQKACMGRGVTIMHIYSSELKYLLIPLPPLNEQQAIAAFLDRRTERIDALCSRVETAIERLQEHRTALIAAAVTGKIDVRDYAPVEMEGNAA